MTFRDFDREPLLSEQKGNRTSCYFAKGLRDFGEFRGDVRRVRDLAGFRRLSADYFR